MFGGMFLVHGIIRYTAGQELSSASMRRMAMASYLFEAVTFMSEAFVFGTGEKLPALGPSIFCALNPISAAHRQTTKTPVEH